MVSYSPQTVIRRLGTKILLKLVRRLLLTNLKQSASAGNIQAPITSSPDKYHV